MRTDTSTEVADVIERLVLWLRRQAPVPLSPSTVTTLSTLETSGPLRISELAESESISQPGMTTLVNRLARAGQAERVPDPTDGRATLVRITDVGRAALAERHAARVAVLVDKLADLDADDRETLAAAVPALQRLIDAGPAPRTGTTPREK